MEKDAKIYVAGNRGMVGSAIVRELKKQGVKANDRVNIIALDKQKKPTNRRLDNLKVVIYDIADRSIATYFPESNNLVDLENIDQQSGIPAYKNIPIVIELAS